MNAFKLLFITLILMMIAVLFVIIGGPDESMTGTPHSRYTTMLQSTHDSYEFSNVKWAGFAFGIGIILYLYLVLAIGLKRKKYIKKINFWILGGGAVYLILFVLMFMAYQNYIDQETLSLLGGFPTPTAIMIYGLWLFPLFFTTLYVWRFKDWVINKKEVARFHELVKSKSHE